MLAVGCEAVAITARNERSDNPLFVPTGPDQVQVPVHSSSFGRVALLTDPRAPDVKRRSSGEREPARQAIGALLQALEIRPHDSELELGVRVSPCGGLFQIGQSKIPLVKLNVGICATKECFGKLRIEPEG